jgi:ADP-heptose:LPS heptosyltransferase
LLLKLTNDGLYSAIHRNSSWGSWVGGLKEANKIRGQLGLVVARAAYASLLAKVKNNLCFAGVILLVMNPASTSLPEQHQTAATARALEAAEIIYQTPLHESFPLESLRLLCELAAAEDEVVARAGAVGLFPALVERLNDSFEPNACDRYDEVFTQVIDYFRRLPAARELDAALRQFNLHSIADLLTRKRRLTAVPHQLVRPERIKKILLLSRVTIGADVAVTSVLLSALQQRFPQAEGVLLGSAKLRELWGGAVRVRIRELSYERGGTVLARLNSWLAVLAAVTDELRGLADDEWLVIDPDSRLTQLGLLPVVAGDRNYFFFESRRYRSECDWPLARLAAQWYSEVFGTPAQVYPQLALPAAHLAFGQAVGAHLRRAEGSHLVSLSLGVGGNPAKRIDEEFEAGLLRALLNDSALLLDKGGAPDERAQVDRLLEPLRAAGQRVLELNAENATERLAAATEPLSVITWDGSIGAFAGLVAASDEYIGYDSAGQHIAAALGVPVLTIFSHNNSPRFAARWRPFGSGLVEVVNVAAEQRAAGKALLEQTCAAHQRLRARATP